MSSNQSSKQPLPCNVRVIQKTVRQASNSPLSTQEYRIQGVRGLVLLILQSGTATWYFHYDVVIGKKRKRRKLKIGRTDEISLGCVIDQVEILRAEVCGGRDPVKDRQIKSNQRT